MFTPRLGHTATLLPNKKVLVAGGFGYGGAGALTDTELYDPVMGTWTETAALVGRRFAHTANLLPNGKVMVAGGYNNSAAVVFSAEVYDPISQTWTGTTSMPASRAYHTATLLPDGKVLLTGGEGNTFPFPLSSSSLYDPAGGAWKASGAMLSRHDRHSATLLPDGSVLVAGGSGLSSITNSAETYDTGLGFSNSWRAQISPLASPLSLGTGAVLAGSRFRGIAGASSGNNRDSPADYPLLQLRSIESEQVIFLLATNWSTNSFNSVPVWNFPPGWALATVFVNGIQSTSSIVNISVPIPTPPFLNGAKKLNDGSFQFTFTNSVGAIFGVLTTTNMSLAFTNWTALGGVTEISPGQFQFTDPQATNNPRRFYNVRAP
jgi:hypothetical protein